MVDAVRIRDVEQELCLPDLLNVCLYLKQTVRHHVNARDLIPYLARVIPLGRGRYSTLRHLYIDYEYVTLIPGWLRVDIGLSLIV